MRVAFDLFQANGLPASRVQGSVVSSEDSPDFRQVCMYVCMYVNIYIHIYILYIYMYVYI